MTHQQQPSPLHPCLPPPVCSFLENNPTSHTSPPHQSGRPQQLRRVRSAPATTSFLLPSRYSPCPPTRAHQAQHHLSPPESDTQTPDPRLRTPPTTRLFLPPIHLSIPHLLVNTPHHSRQRFTLCPMAPTLCASTVWSHFLTTQGGSKADTALLVGAGYRSYHHKKRRPSVKAKKSTTPKTVKKPYRACSLRGSVRLVKRC